MPIKQVTCSVCNSLVNKAITYEIEKGRRACKSHEGVTEKRNAFEAARVAKLTAPPKPPPQPLWKDQISGPPQPTCWVCMNTGLHQQDFFSKVLIEMEKNRIAHGGKTPNIFAPGGMPVLSQRCIFLVSREAAEPAMKYVRDDFQALIGMGGFLAICGPCCGTFKIEPLPKVSREQLVDWMVLAEIMKPAIHELAVKELVRDN